MGSGLGRCGLLAHRLAHEGATTVLTDGDTDVLKQLRRNVARNAAGGRGGGAVSCVQLLWGEDRAEAFLERQRQRSSCGGKFDLILGSDLIYVTSVIRPLFETVQVLLSDDPGSRFLMAHCARREGNEVDLPAVMEGAAGEGFNHKVLEEEGDISVFCFTRKGAD